MKKLLVFVGDSGSGKTTLISELTKKYPEKFKKVVTCTSRPPRISEVDEKDYHFLPAGYFINNLDFLVLVGYAKNGTCYGTRKSDLCSKTRHLLLTSKPAGIQKLIDLGFRNIVVVRIIINKELKIARMQHRGDSEKAIFERLEIDTLTTPIIDFGLISVVSLDANQSLDEKVEIILKVC